MILACLIFITAGTYIVCVELLNNSGDPCNAETSSLIQEIEIEKSPFSLLCEYGTEDYDLQNGKVMGSKAVVMKVKTNMVKVESLED